MNPVHLQRLLLTVLPVMVFGALVVSAIWGPDGLVTWYSLRRVLDDAIADQAAVERQNHRLLREIRLTEVDPLVLERVATEELARGRTGTVVYRFED